MPLYKIKIELERLVEADHEDDAIAEWENDLAVANDTLISDIIGEAKITEVCPHCEIELKPKMIDVDGTNLEEHYVCEKCGYGTPALK